MTLGLRKSATYCKVLPDGSKEYGVNFTRLEEIVPQPVDPFVLMLCPASHVALEFDNRPRLENVPDVIKLYNKSKALNIEGGIYDHAGKSPYLWLIFNRDLTWTEKKVAAQELCPPEAWQYLDKGNLGNKTLVPIPGGQHWKYRTVHEFVSGVPIERQGYAYPQEWADEAAKIDAAATIDHHRGKDAAGERSATADEVMQHDFKLRRLLSGDLCGCPSPSEARMVALCICAGYGLSKTDMTYCMSQSHGLNWHEKPHLHSREIDKAISYASRYPRRLLKRGEG